MHRMTIRRTRLALPTLVITLCIAACGDSPLDPDVTGLVDARIHDDPTGSAGFNGTAAGNFFVSVRSTGGTWVDLGSPNGITADLQSAVGTTVHGPSSVPAGSFNRVRLTLSGVTFSLDAGGMVEGNTLPSDASAEAAATAPLVLDFDVSDFDVVEGGATVRIAFDLNVESWIDQQSLDDEVIADSQIEGQVTVEVIGS